MGSHDVLRLAAAGTAGLASGLASFAGLWWTLRLALPGTSRWWIFGFGALLRLAFLAAVFRTAVHAGLPESLAALAGFLLAREIALRRYALGPGSMDLRKGASDADKSR
jgi:F1F0 ATPase subunit 2